MNKQDMFKIQTCVLGVNVHCDGCKHKIKRKLQKIEGVYEVSIDVEQGKVTVSGNVDPAILIKKLDKAGRHAELLWGPQNGPTSTIKSHFKNMQISKDSTTRNGGFRAPQQNNNLKDVRFLGKDQKSVKFRLPEDQEEDDDFDEDDNEFDDEFDEGFASHNQPPTNAHGTQANKTSLNGHLKGKFGSTSGKKSNKGSGMNKFIKGILGKTGGEKGCPGKTHNKAANQNGGSKNRDKNGAMDGKGAEAAHKNINDSCSKKVGENSDTGQKLDGKQLQKGFNAINTKDRRGSGGKTGPMGGHTGPMGGQMENFWGGNTGPVGGQMSNTGPMGGGQMGNFEAVRGLQPTTVTAMNVGNFQRNPFNQEYMGHMMMMMNQQRENAYMRSQSPMSYGPPTMTDQYTHIFSDESTSSCSIM